MPVSDVDLDELLVRVPFATLDLEALPTSSLGFSPSSECLPGLIPDTDTPQCRLPNGQHKSREGTQEIALRVISSAHYRVSRLRIVFKPAKRPSRLEVSVASAPLLATKGASTDAVSQYLSASFTRLGDPIVWPPESALCWPLGSTEIVIPVALPDNAPTPFIKLIMHRPHAHPDNLNHEIVLSGLELLGTFQLSSREIHLREDEATPESGQGPSPVRQEANSIRHSLEAAGLPESLIQELLNSPNSMSSADAIVDSDADARDDEPLVQQVAPDETVMEQSVLDSPFDVAMREFVDVEARLDGLLASIDSPRNEMPMPHETPGHSLSLPRIDHQNQRHLQAIATHTFGSFFTQCLLSRRDQDRDGQSGVHIEGLRIVERLAPLLLLAELPVELVFEGLVAVVALVLYSDSACSLSVFHAALQLVRTTFQERRSGFCLVNGLSQAQLNAGLNMVIGAVLATPHCWSLGSKTTVDRELLKTMRLLMTQNLTRSSFLRSVVHFECKGNQEVLKCENLQAPLNRLRVIRWVLQRHADKLSASDRVMIRSCIDTFASGNQAGSPLREKQVDLREQCLRLISKLPDSNVSDFDAQLLSLRKHLQQDAQCPGTDTAKHVPLFEACPITQDQQTLLVSRLKQYFQLHQRPVALYQHDFNNTSLGDNSDGKTFRKGNIVFRGIIEERHAPTNSFHDTMETQTRPFEFRAPATQVANEMPLVTMETSFARFRGTVEARTSERMTSETTRRALETLNRDLPNPPMSRPVPNVKLNRVVPVNDSKMMPSYVESATASTVVPPVEATAAPVPPVSVAEETAVRAPEKRRASTAAPGITVEKTTATNILATESVNGAVDPPKPTVAAPKTAPPGNPRKSQDAGCAVQ